MTVDLESLRKLADDWYLEDNHKSHFGLWYRAPDVLRQAADALTEQREEIEALRAELEAARKLARLVHKYTDNDTLVTDLHEALAAFDSATHRSEQDKA